MASGAETVTVSPGLAEDGLTAYSGGEHGGAPPTEGPQPEEASITIVAAHNIKARR
ncbi:hypothetical protein [Arthrobacter sp. 9V]|uniref:hypothetical protein n=1 Tax=Arthrobacter sp. 9V TaxID=2653132 RepID=UPI001AEA6C94|nr:hypothetical protein [Arthrobacter sp. 9V]